MPHLVCRTSLACLATILLSSPALAEPVELAAQGRLTSQGGGAVADGTYGMAIALWDAATAGNLAFKESFIAVTVTGGVFALPLGAVETKLDSATFGGGKALWVGITVGADPELTRQPLRKAPYAVHATIANSAADLQCSGCVGADDLAKAAVSGEKIANGAVGANHVSFSWAGGDSPGGAATFALAANSAKIAESAKQATTATFADEAASAKTADVATSAKALQCTGCITLEHLAKSASDAFLSSKGGSVDGKLDVTGAVTASGGVDLGASALKNANLGVQDPAKDPCTAKEAGRLASTVAGTLWFCTGKAWQKVRLCSGNCLKPDAVACGAAVTDDCGDVNICGGAGSLCANGGVCQSGTCTSTLGQQTNPAQSCKQLLTVAPASKDGEYWLDPDGLGNAVPFKGLCDMTTDGGGWSLVGYAGTIKGTKEATVGKLFAPLFDDFGTYSSAAPVSKAAFSRLDLFVPLLAPTLQFMARRTGAPNRILIWPVADVSMWRQKKTLPLVTYLRMSKDGKTFFDRKNNLTVFDDKPMPAYTGYNWNTPKDENCDNCGRSFDTALNHRSLLYWETGDSGSAGTQWFHGSPMTLEDSTSPVNSVQDIEFWLR
ncbi:MAG: hypothetical protein EXR77_19750 [Myxococcales bacterium]|nr:hypothetical protein [Myxococcales bacterium]